MIMVIIFNVAGFFHHRTGQATMRGQRRAP